MDGNKEYRGGLTQIGVGGGGGWYLVEWGSQATVYVGLLIMSNRVNYRI